MENQRTFGGQFQKLIEDHTNEATFGRAKDSAIVQIVDLLLGHGYDSKASDIHIEPERKHTAVRFRIDGVMQDIAVIPKNIHDLIMTRVKIMAKLRTDEHQLPQDGKLEYEFENEIVDIRISIIPTVKGENIVMRLLSEKGRHFTLDDLGFAKREYSLMMKHAKKPWGMILATGPTGAGKTTTLYGVLKILNTRDVNIITIEDPVEYTMEGVTQIQTNQKAKLTFSTGLRSIVRQDPNIIMVGEIRDEETAEIAVNSAMTGHLVLSSMHTNDSATTLPRFLEMGIKPFLVGSTINVVIGQRLLRKICRACIVSYEVYEEQMKNKLPYPVLQRLMGGKEKISLYKGAGCSSCQNKGYLGRIGVFELLEMTDEIRTLIMQDANSAKIQAQAMEQGMTTMFDDALQKVLAGATTIEEMLRVVKQ